MINVALVDDHEVTRHGIKTILELNRNVKVIVEASNGRLVLEQLSCLVILPDIILLDITMPEMDGFLTLDMLQSKFSSIKIIIFSLYFEEDIVMDMISRGASAYINKSADPHTLTHAVLTVHKYGFCLSNLVKKDYFIKNNELKKKPGFNGKSFLNAKEVEFIRLSATNLNYKEIAERMFVSPKTIENYRDSLFQKLDIKNRATLALYGFKNGLISYLPE